ncbi:MAG: O-antigen ligase family protein [Gammaproteobacteria bacterium]
MFEAPKTVFLLLFYASCAFEQWKKRHWASFDGDDLLIFCWMGSGFIVALFAGIHYKEWGGANGPLMLGLLLLLLKRAELNDNNIRFLLLAVLFSSLVADIEGLWQLATGKQRALELNSVGHVNHSAIYLCLNFAPALAFTLVLHRKDPLAIKIFIICCLLMTALSIIISNSRATIVTMGIIAFLCGLIWTKRSKLPLLFLIFSLTITAGGLYFGKARVVQKHFAQTSHGAFLGERGPIWNSALLTWRHYPLFGIGIKNYAQATPERQEQWLAEEGQHYIPGEYLAYAHAHSFYLTTLAEQGLFGFSVTVLVLARICLLLYRHRPQSTDCDGYWVAWCGAFGAILVVLVNGLFNTTLHHEHGLLSVLLIGLWWTASKQRDKPAGSPV